MKPESENGEMEAVTQVRTGSGGAGMAAGHSRSSLAPGTNFGSYRVLSRLGEGGMGEVFEVEHAVLQQRYALKLLHAELASGTEGRDRFAREARVMASLHHPGIVRVDDFGEAEGRVWLRMELADGAEVAPGERVRTLGALQAARGGRLPADATRDALAQILVALHVAHAAGLVHRDLKPANILLDGQGRMKIADFGLVQLAGEDWLRSRVNATVARSMTLGSAPTRVDAKSSGTLQAGERALMGTWEYMSPEQKSGGAVDARSDLYAVGLIAFRLLTGETVLAMEMPSEIVADLDPAWDGWMRKAVASRPEKRFSSAAEMAAALPNPAAASTVVVTPPKPQPIPGVRPAPATPVAAASSPPPLPVVDQAATAAKPPGPAFHAVTPPDQPSAAKTAAPASVAPTGTTDVADGFRRVAMGLGPACLWSLVSPGIGLALRGRPVAGFLISVLPQLAVVLFAVSIGYLEPALPLIVTAATAMVGMAVLLSDGRSGVFGGPSAAAALAKARSLRGWYTAALVLTILATVLLFATTAYGTVVMMNQYNVQDEEIGLAVILGLAGCISAWFAVRLARIRRFLGTVRGPG